ncbi:hypothetical protein CPB97_003070 [Podila verticillata]|nr:hypothetical protein CPB97_003070 [Podila verticillata]
MNARPQYGATWSTTRTWSTRGQQARAQNGTAGDDLGKQSYNQRGYTNGTNAYTRSGPFSSYWTKELNPHPRYGSTSAWNTKGPQARSHNETAVYDLGRPYGERKYMGKPYSRPGPTRNQRGRAFSNQILKSRDTNARPLDGPGAYRTNDHGRNTQNKSTWRDMSHHTQKGARGRHNRKTRRARGGNENSSTNLPNDAKVDTWLNQFTDSLIKVSLNPNLPWSQTSPPKNPVPVVSLLDEEQAREVGPTISKQMVLHSARDSQFSGKEFELLYPNFSWPLSGSRWVEKMTEYDTYDPILIRLRDIMRGIHSYKHFSVLPFATPRQYQKMGDERGNKKNRWDPNRLPPKWVPEVVYVFGEQWGGSQSAQEELQERRAMWKRVDRALNTLQMMKYEGASTLEMIETLDDLAEAEVMANQLESKLIPKYGYTKEHIARLKW